MKILIITHASFERPGSILNWAKRNNHDVQEVKPYEGEAIPPAKQFDLIVMMGGPQSPLEIDQSPYLADEILMLKDAIHYKKRIVGICLGAQLISEALGAKTERSPNREVGCFALESLDFAKEDPIFGQLPKNIDVMHWHNDMPGMPQDAVLLAKSEGCPRQIYSFGDRIYGFQCHFELTQELVRNMINHCPDDLKDGKYVMTEQELMQVDYAKMNAVMDKVLDYLASLSETE